MPHKVQPCFGLDGENLVSSTNPLPIVNATEDIFFGDVPGKIIINGFGEREGMGTTSTGEDIWRGTAVTIPLPADIGEQMEVVSSNTNDTSAGTGVRTVLINYLDATGTGQTTTVTMNGTTGVALTPSDVRYIQSMNSVAVGSGGVAAGAITIYKQGAASTIYNMIDDGGNMSLVPNYMVPLAKTLFLKTWHAEEAQGKRVAIRIRSTDRLGVLYPGVFIFKDSCYLNDTTTGPLEIWAELPALSVLKVSGWPDVAGADVSVGWSGVLVDD